MKTNYFAKYGINNPNFEQGLGTPVLLIGNPALKYFSKNKFVLSIKILLY
jgi:hypothetical protein